MIIRYKECFKNHAATLGGNATDGCGELMAAGEEGTFEALKCLPCEEEVQNQVHTRTEGENVGFCREGRVEDAEVRGICSAEVLPRGWNQEESPQSVDAQ
ncbi:hypothetical protein RJT34_16461 [Clitoria ternatea]|uniref:ZF-HD dimerization-type domain-containing protein n=1 Tax=Clitoria ternatea TaxID=43366 RepID=A0AAN9J771_CLITE